MSHCPRCDRKYGFKRLDPILNEQLCCDCRELEEYEQLDPVDRLMTDLGYEIKNSEWVAWPDKLNPGRRSPPTLCVPKLNRP